jgi:hypothetical protein
MFVCFCKIIFNNKLDLFTTTSSIIGRLLALLSNIGLGWKRMALAYYDIAPMEQHILDTSAGKQLS